MNVEKLDLKNIHRAARAMGATIFDDARGYDLNLHAIRSTDRESNSFDDLLCVSWTFAGCWNSLMVACTTDAGTYYRRNFATEKGTAILPNGLHKGLWKLGKHQGKYDALVQAREVGVLRDADRDGTLEAAGALDTGWHGINLHMASSSAPSLVVDRWSAGCIVIQDPDMFAAVLALCRRQVKATSFATFSITIIPEETL